MKIPFHSMSEGVFSQSSLSLSLSHAFLVSWLFGYGGGIRSEKMWEKLQIEMA